MRLPILRGALRGRWWLPASRGRVLRVLLGSYEPEQTTTFLRHVHPGGTFLDVGAHAGYYTLLGARCVGPAGRVWSFEPHPRNAHYLREHVRINGHANVTVQEAAVAVEDGTARFGGGTGTGTGRLTDDGSFEVRTLGLDGFCRQHAITPTAIKIDVEGAEADVLEGAAGMLGTARPVLFLSTHGRAPHEASIERLEALDYVIRPIDDVPVASSSELLCLPEGG